jgi:hypothetical protein
MKGWMEVITIIMMPLQLIACLKLALISGKKISVVRAEPRR